MKSRFVTQIQTAARLYSVMYSHKFIIQKSNRLQIQSVEGGQHHCRKMSYNCRYCHYDSYFRSDEMTFLELLLIAINQMNTSATDICRLNFVSKSYVQVSSPDDGNYTCVVCDPLPWKTYLSVSSSDSLPSFLILCSKQTRSYSNKLQHVI